MIYQSNKKREKRPSSPVIFKFEELFSNLRNSLAFSILGHFLLLLLFLVINTGFRLKTSEFAEISFVSGSPIRPSMRQGSARSILPPAQKEQLPTKPLVNLPERRMLEDESPLLTERQRDKLSPDLDTAILPDRTREPDYSEKITSDRVGERHVSQSPLGVEKIDSGSRDKLGSEPFSPTGSEQLFSIEGDAARRSIVRKIIPQYPPGLQKEATIKVRFEVLPDGTVSNMIPMIKGEPTLENLTLEALRQWQFNPLPPALEQKTVTGIITFRYLLR